jgi:aminoglycoside 2'-N-acetyltransferase I
MHERIRTARTEELGPAVLAQIRALLDAAFAGRWDEHDWDHCLGGDHLLWVEDGRLVGQAAVVPRIMRTGGKSWRTGYVEAVAVSPDAQGRGVGRELMLAANDLVTAGYELGGLSAGERAARLYQQLGWQRWAGPTFVDGPQGTIATPEEDGSVYVLPLVEMDLTEPIACDWRDGDVW